MLQRQQNQKVGLPYRCSTQDSKPTSTAPAHVPFRKTAGEGIELQTESHTVGSIEEFWNIAEPVGNRRKLIWKTLPVVWCTLAPSAKNIQGQDDDAPSKPVTERDDKDAKMGRQTAGKEKADVWKAFAVNCISCCAGSAVTVKIFLQRYCCSPPDDIIETPQHILSFLIPTIAARCKK